MKTWVTGAQVRLPVHQGNRSDYFEHRVKMMGWWSDHIEQASQGNLSLARGFKALTVVS
ncbi:hypothetical protein [Aeromonas bestiarum]|uniref:hypothetical protein n=1 Tax=Aeromonas bestiarum TaxID=105751 RepID=UPI0012EDBCCF|nr:hypothetical protein [Aeromonas bestiarum]